MSDLSKKEADLNKSTGKLTKKQEDFINFYIGEAQFNGRKAAQLAGYSGSGNVLDATASRLLRQVKVVKRIKQLGKEEKKQAILDREGRRRKLSEIALNSKEKTSDQLKAIELLGKMGGDFIERRQVDVTQHKAKEDQAKSKEFISTVKPEQLQDLLDKTYGDETTVN